MQKTKTPTMVNPDDLFVRGLRRRIRGNNGFCPTKRGKSKDSKCPCAEYRDGGRCDCGLFIPAAPCVAHIQ